MKQVIKNINGEVLFDCLADSLKEAVEMALRQRVSLKGADLSNSDLYGVNLQHANLIEANLCFTDLRDSRILSADLCGANLSYADLSGADLKFSDLRNANLFGANLYFADTYRTCIEGIDLRSANLRGVDFSYSNFSDAKFDAEIPDDIRVVPKEGEFIGWKKCRDGVVVKLLIPADAVRSNGFSRKCRASKAIVMEVFGARAGRSKWDQKTMYYVGDTVYSDNWDSRWWYECSNGIHFFMKREEAEKY